MKKSLKLAVRLDQSNLHGINFSLSSPHIIKLGNPGQLLKADIFPLKAVYMIGRVKFAEIRAAFPG